MVSMGGNKVGHSYTKNCDADCAKICLLSAHLKNCSEGRSSCSTCRDFLKILKIHSMTCKDDNCPREIETNMNLEISKAVKMGWAVKEEGSREGVVPSLVQDISKSTFMSKEPLKSSFNEKTSILLQERDGLNKHQYSNSFYCSRRKKAKLNFDSNSSSNDLGDRSLLNIEKRKKFIYERLLIPEKIYVKMDSGNSDLVPKVTKEYKARRNNIPAQKGTVVKQNKIFELKRNVVTEDDAMENEDVCNFEIKSKQESQKRVRKEILLDANHQTSDGSAKVSKAKNNNIVLDKMISTLPFKNLEYKVVERTKCTPLMDPTLQQKKQKLEDFNTNFEFTSLAQYEKVISSTFIDKAKDLFNYYAVDKASGAQITQLAEIVAISSDESDGSDEESGIFEDFDDDVLNWLRSEIVPNNDTVTPNQFDVIHETSTNRLQNYVDAAPQSRLHSSLHEVVPPMSPSRINSTKFHDIVTPCKIPINEPVEFRQTNHTKHSTRTKRQRLGRSKQSTSIYPEKEGYNNAYALAPISGSSEDTNGFALEDDELEDLTLVLFDDYDCT